MDSRTERRYIILSANNAQMLEQLVNGHIDEYEPVGGVGCHQVQGSFPRLVQAMVKRRRVAVTRGPQLHINGEVADNAALSRSLDRILAEMAEEYCGSFGRSREGGGDDEP